MATKFLYILAFFWFLSTYAQTSGSKATGDFKYEGWYNVNFVNTNRNRSWLLYFKDIEHGKSQLILQNTSKEISFEVDNARAEFYGNDYFISMSDARKISIWDLRSLDKSILEGYSNFYIIPERGILLEEAGKSPGTSRFGWWDFKGKKTRFISETYAKYKWLQEEYRLILFFPESLALFDFKRSFEYRLNMQGKDFVDLQWDEAGKFVDVLYSVNLKHYLKRVWLDRAKEEPEVPVALPVLNSGNIKIARSSGDTVLFEAAYPKKEEAQPVSDVEIWGSADNRLYPTKKVRDLKLAERELYLWHYKSGQILSQFKIGFRDYTCLDNKKILVTDNQKYQDYRTYLNKVDISLIDLSRSDETPVVENFIEGNKNWSVAPDKSKIAYFRDNNWWLVDVKSQQQHNLTQHLPPLFATDSFFSYDPFKKWLWGTNHKAYIIDKKSVWEVDLSTATLKKLMFKESLSSAYSIIQFEGRFNETIDSKNIFIKEVTASNDEIIARWDGTGLKTLYRTSNKIADQDPYPHLINDHIYFREENYNVPPKVMSVNLKGQTKALISSNPDYHHYKWSRREEVHYLSSTGKETLKGLLYYPVDYKVGKKYPMVVRIYQRQSEKAKVFNLPSNGTPSGFNIDFLTRHNYFVFLPDIETEPNNAGDSALKCVRNAIDRVLEKNIIDAGKLGLWGHSFGGYETNYIVSHSNIFKAAVSGAGIADLTNWYFSIWYAGFPGFWRFEDQQWKMTMPYFDNPLLYLSQSPLQSANKINTPLLIWSGKEDMMVNMKQSESLYLALRHLNKPAILLLYPKEGHVLMKKENKIDVTQRAIDWFDYYLKGNTKSWIEEKLKKDGG